MADTKTEVNNKKVVMPDGAPIREAPKAFGKPVAAKAPLRKPKKPRLPAHAKKAYKRGLISDRQMSKLRGEA